jgi:competence protein ComEC
VDSGLSWAYYGLLALITTAVVRKWPGQQQKQQMNNAPALLSRRTWRIIQFGAALAMVLATGTMALAAQPDGRLTITFLSLTPSGEQAPQGEAILITTPDGKTILIDGGLDPTPLGEELDSRLPFWQRSLDMVVLTSTRPDNLGGLQDIISRYQVGEVVDAGMLHPNSAYALWRRMIEQRGLQYVQVRQGTGFRAGTQLMLQVLWPSSPLHKSSNEERDNALVVRLVAPGVRMLLLGDAAESKFALNGLLTGIDQSYLQGNIVQITSEVGKDFPTELSAVLQAAHPSQLVITPGALSAKQRKAGVTTSIVLPPWLAAGGTVGQVIQTAQVGPIEVDVSGSGWNIQAA